MGTVNYAFPDPLICGSISTAMARSSLLIAAAFVAFGAAAQVPSDVPTQGLVGWWPFNGNADDESGNGNDGVVNGPLLTTDRNGDPNSAYAFDGIDDVIAPGQNGIPLGTSPRTVSLWFQRTGGSGCVFAYGSAGTGQAYMVEIGPDIISNQGWADDLPANVTIDNAWHHLVTTFDGSVAAIYLDGDQLVSAAEPGWSTQAGTFYFGTRVLDDMDFWSGKLDDIGLWDRALSPEEVLALYLGIPAGSLCDQVRMVSSTDTVCAGSPVELSMQAPHGSCWQDLGAPTDAYLHVVKANDGTFFVVRTYGGTPQVVSTTDLSDWSQGISPLPSVPAIMAGRTPSGRLFIGSAHDGVYASDDNGANWNYVFGAGYGCGALDLETVGDDTLFISLGGYLRGIYRSVDGGATWTPEQTGTDFTVLSHAEGTSILFAQDYNGQVWRSVNMGATWTHLSATPFDGLAALVHCEDGRVWVVATDGQVYRSQDMGATWPLVGSVPLGSTPTIYSNELLADGQGTIWLGMNAAGIWKSADDGASWTSGGACLSGEFGFFYRDDTLLLATTSTGIYRLNALEGSTWSWSTGATTAGIQVAPDTTTTYTCTWSLGPANCSDSLTIAVLPPDSTTITAVIPTGDTYPFDGNDLDATGIYTAYYVNIHGCDSVVTLDLTVVPGSVQVNARIFLEAPYVTADGLLRDDLRSAGLLPLVEPYTGLGYFHIGNGGNEETTPAVLAVTGPDAVVDWVVIEIRDQDANIRLDSRSALLQRDGDVVDMDGVSPVTFGVAPGTYYISVKHRNHLGVMTATPVVLAYGVYDLDLTQAATAVYGTAARKTIGGVEALWAGDATGNGQIKYAGGSNDRDAILVRIGGTVPTAVENGYFSEDVTMDGQVKYAGSGNDRDPILVNIGGTVPTAVRNAQVP